MGKLYCKFAPFLFTYYSRSDFISKFLYVYIFLKTYIVEINFSLWTTEELLIKNILGIFKNIHYCSYLSHMMLFPFLYQ